MLFKRIWAVGLMVLLAVLLRTAQTSATPAAQSSTSLVLLAPSACPSGGCAAGQRLSYRLNFEVGQYAPASGSPNVKVCVYLPAGWMDASSVQVDSTGGFTGLSYANVTSAGCAEDPLPPTGYTLAAAVQTQMNAGYFFDTLDFHFRIARTATAPGSVLMRVFEDTTGAGNWARTGQAFTSQMSVLAWTGSTAYLAGSPSACTQSPCFLNSAGDSAGGLGTGLRDAVDALPAGGRIVVLGTVTLKGQSVTLNKPMTLEGESNAVLTTQDSLCANPLLEVTAGLTLRGLTINDGACTSPSRTLILVNTANAVLIEGNDLVNGADAISVVNVGTSLTVRYNHITGNSGYALYWGSASSAPLLLVANNLHQNRSGSAVECAAGASAPVANRLANHNYWGDGVVPSASETHCTLDPARRLGAPIARNSASAGVRATRLTVTTSKTYLFDNQIALQRSSDGSDVDVYVVNHGADVPASIPSFSSSAGSPNPCGDAFDVFLAENATPSGTLELSFKYNRSTACMAVIESTQYCELSSNASKFPLWWLDPSGVLTAGWDTTGQNPAGSGAGGASGQTTTCDMGQDEIRVAVDTSGKPSFTEMGFTPFMVGLPIPATFRLLASNQTVTVQWSTTTEADISGFYILRSLSANGPFDPITDLIPRKGSALSGSDYTFVDGGRPNGVMNYYRLKVIRTDGGYIYSDILSIVPNTPTPTFTPTRTRTWTPVPTFTATFRPFPSPTRGSTTRPVNTPTRVSSLTPTRTATPGTGTPRTPTRTLSPTAGTPGAPTPTMEGYLPPDQGTALPTEGGYIPPGESTLPPDETGEVTSTTTAETTATPSSAEPGDSATPSPTSSQEVPVPAQNASDWISLVLGLLFGGVVGLGFLWYLFLRKDRRDDSEP